MTNRESKLLDLLDYLLKSTEQYRDAEIAQRGLTAPPRSHIQLNRARINDAVVYVRARMEDIKRERRDEESRISE